MTDGQIVIEITADTAEFTAQLQALAGSAQQLVSRWLGVLESSLPQASATGRQLVSSLISGMSTMAASLRSRAVQLVTSALSGARGVSFAIVGSGMVSGIISGVSGSAGRLYSSLRTLAQNALSSAKRALGIASPSKVFRDQVGRWIPSGIGEGIERELPSLSAQLQRELSGLTMKLQTSVQNSGGTVLPVSSAPGTVSAQKAQTVPTQQVLLQLDSRTVAQAVAHDVGGYLEWEVL